MIGPFDQLVNPFIGGPSAEHKSQVKQIDQKFREQVIATFCTPHGMQLLDTLDDLYVRQPVCPAGCVEGYGYMREGENRLIIKLRAIVNSAQGQL
mgnify:CR=1 FL=1